MRFQWHVQKESDPLRSNNLPFCLQNMVLIGQGKFVQIYEALHFMRSIKLCVYKHTFHHINQSYISLAWGTLRTESSMHKL
jgi:hypothetical protein